MNRQINIPFELIERFALRNHIPLQESIEIHHDLLDYLDAGRKIKSKAHRPTMIVDEAWHNFILHTKLYSDFCFSRYGEFIHHFPSGNDPDPHSKLHVMMKGQPYKKAKCNDGTGDGNCSNACGQSDCSDTDAP